MSNLKSLLAIGSVCSALSGCYVVPAQPYAGASPAYTPTPAAVVLARPPYAARLYPVNDAAAAMGRVNGVITNPERGHGEFSFSVGGETYVGEATRDPGSSRGRAAASGNRGGYAQCDYAMTSATLGSGTCNFSNGARYELHVSL